MYLIGNVEHYYLQNVLALCFDCFDLYLMNTDRETDDECARDTFHRVLAFNRYGIPVCCVDFIIERFRNRLRNIATMAEIFSGPPITRLECVCASVLVARVCTIDFILNIRLCLRLCLSAKCFNIAG